MKKIELITDNKFETGFHLLGINPTINHRKLYRHLDYDGQAKKANRPIWQMAQWWTPFDFTNAVYRTNKDKHIYENASRKIEVQSEPNGHLRLNLYGSKEYPEGPRASGNQPWSHLLIEQDFEKSVSLDQLESLNLKLTFNIESFKDMSAGQYDPSLHAAQLLWYFVIHDQSIEGSTGYGNFKEYFWFGIPLFDNRYKTIGETMHIDQGGIGTTGHLIYSMASKNYLNEPIQFGKTYDIEIDILPHILNAKQYALDHGYLKKTDHSNYQIGYMNFGWEIPGMFDVESYIENMQAIAVLK